MRCPDGRLIVLAYSVARMQVAPLLFLPSPPPPPALLLPGNFTLLL